jgi:hypothetical protein
LCKYLFILFMFLPIDGMDWCFPFDCGFISRYRYTQHGLQRHSITLKKLTWKAICFDNYFFCTFGFDHHMYTYTSDFRPRDMAFAFRFSAHEQQASGHDNVFHFVLLLSDQ